MNRTTLKRSFTILLALVASAGSAASAAIITYETPDGFTNAGEPVDASATITTSADTISILLENFQPDPNSPKQVIYGLKVEVSTGQNTGTLNHALSGGLVRNVNADGTFVDSAFTNTTGEWNATSSGALLHLNGLNAGPDWGVIGPPNAGTLEYDQANPPIAGGNHNPFYRLSANFVINVPGVTASSTIKAATFVFNTDGDYPVPGVSAPEPSSLLLSGVCAGAFLPWLRRRQVV